MARGEVLRFLEGYAARHRPQVRLGGAVARVDRTPGGSGWSLTTGEGEVPWAPYAIVGDRLQPHTAAG